MTPSTLCYLLSTSDIYIIKENYWKHRIYYLIFDYSEEMFLNQWTEVDHLHNITDKCKWFAVYFVYFRKIFSYFRIFKSIGKLYSIKGETLDYAFSIIRRSTDIAWAKLHRKSWQPVGYSGFTCHLDKYIVQCCHIITIALALDAVHVICLEIISNPVD